ncbi:PREDICTED: uncharacterized protein LOC109229238 isoform X3 [Nicotiana attenuata]|uniref:uncharacterized protein LOC109229238 isoform X3 n=1 Tax=Nicotiana attenuata TaxID=49451 RepID=UPI000905204B|nr:PREDICTED: uncharacterized protein LOC109229238 isoform X3 [Nicotiana attenuata]
MKDLRAILGNNRIEDVRWLCSLTESEIDLLIGLKVLIQQRAKKIGHESLANKFDLKTLRALNESSANLGACNLLNYDLDKTFANMEVEQLSSYICSDKRKRIIEMRTVTKRTIMEHKNKVTFIFAERDL